MVHWEKKYYAISIEFQERGSPHVNSFIWISMHQTVCIEFIKKIINAQLPGYLKDPELFQLVKTYYVHAHTTTCLKYNKNECHFSYGRYFTEKSIIAKPHDSKPSNDEKKKFLTWRNALLKQVKNPTKDNFTQPLNFIEILDKKKFLRKIITEPYPYQKMKI